MNLSIHSNDFQGFALHPANAFDGQRQPNILGTQAQGGCYDSLWLSTWSEAEHEK